MLQKQTDSCERILPLHGVLNQQIWFPGVPSSFSLSKKSSLSLLLKGSAEGECENRKKKTGVPFTYGDSTAGSPDGLVAGDVIIVEDAELPGVGAGHDGPHRVVLRAPRAVLVAALEVPGDLVSEPVGVGGVAGVAAEGRGLRHRHQEGEEGEGTGSRHHPTAGCASGKHAPE